MPGGQRTSTTAFWLGWEVRVVWTGDCVTVQEAYERSVTTTVEPSAQAAHRERETMVLGVQQNKTTTVPTGNRLAHPMFGRMVRAEGWRPLAGYTSHPPPAPILAPYPVVCTHCSLLPCLVVWLGWLKFLPVMTAPPRKQPGIRSSIFEVTDCSVQMRYAPMSFTPHHTIPSRCTMHAA